MNTTPLQKRIKRHLIGRTREYFIITPPGFEDLCRQELCALPLSVQDAESMPGGVTFQGRLADCHMANLCLRTATRVLLRLHRFRAASFSAMEKSLKEIPKELYLFPGARLSFSVSTSGSRLFHKQAIAERAARILGNNAASQNGENNGSVPHHRIFIRGVEDRFTVSIDSSGEPLYKRGLKPGGGQAPLRETSAAAILMIAGYTRGATLVDPMCGTGTFSLEAGLISAGTPPGACRDFAFMEWPSFGKKRWEYLRGEFLRQRHPEPAFPLIHASDRAKKSCSLLNRSLFSAGLKAYAEVNRRDFFQFTPADIPAPPGLIVLNPPYGIRMGSPARSRDLFGRICRRLASVWGGWRAALICPDREWLSLVPFPARTVPLIQGGRRMTVLFGDPGSCR